MDFTGKVAVVTGGANGIGRAVTLGFARLGAKVVIVDRDATAGTALAAEIGSGAIFRAADVTRSGDVQDYVKAALDAFGAIDCFHNNAGIEGRVAPTAEYDEAVFDAVMGVNAKGVFLGMRHVLPVMITPGIGRRGEYRLSRRTGRDHRDGGLCRVQACGDRADQGGGRRGRQAWHPGERRVSRADRYAHGAGHRETGFSE